jgi:hypothetical protein
MPKRLVLMSGVYDIERHYEYEAARGVSELSTMARAVGGRGKFPEQSPAVLLAAAASSSADAKSSPQGKGKDNDKDSGKGNNKEKVRRGSGGGRDGGTWGGADVSPTWALHGEVLSTWTGYHAASQEHAGELSSALSIPTKRERKDVSLPPTRVLSEASRLSRTNLCL